jgi:HK97 family phage portal protein
MSDLITPSGLPLELKKGEEGKGKIVGLTPWRDQFNFGRGVKGAAIKKGSWRDYYDMYKQHAMLRAAIDKIAKTATNVGYDFVPRDTTTKLKKREVNVLKAFFDKQEDFVGELRKIYKDLLIYGDAYMYLVPDRRRRPVKLKRLHPKTIHIKSTRNGDIQAYYQKDPDDLSDEVVVFQPQEILHFRIDDPDNDLYGLSPLESLKWAVSADLYAQRYNSSFFQHSGVTGTIIGIRNANPDEVQRNRKWLEENYTGPESAHKPLVIEGESIEIKKSVATHNEMGFLEGRKFIILEILAVLDVPPAKVGIMETANRSNSREQDKTFRTESVSPLQVQVEAVINGQFIKKILGIENTVFVHSEGDTRDAIEQMDYYTKGEAWGIFNANEIRAKLGMAPVDGGDTNGIMTPTGFIPLDRLQLFFALPQANIEDVPEHPNDPILGEPPPKTTIRQVAAISRDTAKSTHPSLSAQGAMLKLLVQHPSDADVRQAYCYLNDAQSLNDPRITLSKAVRVEDEFLKLGYVERAQEAMSQLLVPLERANTPQDQSLEVEDDEI